MTKKIRIGDVIEIMVDQDYCYAQYCYLHSRYGALIRVFLKRFSNPQSDLSLLCDGKEDFVTFFPLQAAVKKNIFRICGNFQIPERAQALPTFRTGMPDPKTGKVNIWWLWNGDKEWRVGVLSKEQREFPILEIWNDTLLVERIRQGWTPVADFS